MFFGASSLGEQGAGFFTLAGGTAAPPPPPVLHPPQITSPLTHSGTIGTAIANYTFTATNAQTRTVTGLPPGLSFNVGTGVISGTPTPGVATAGPHNITLTATNGPLTDTKTLVLTLAAQPVPSITSILTHSGIAGTPISTYTITASNPPITAFHETGLPIGLSLNPLNGQITGSTTLLGAHTVHISATNSGGTGPAANLVITISAGALSQIDSPLAVSGEVGKSFSYTITATNSPTSFTVTGLPTGLNHAGNQITGTLPLTPGTHNITLVANNTHGPGNPATLVLTVEAAVVTSSVIFIANTASPPTGTQRGQLWVQSNTRNVRWWSTNSGPWSAVQAGG